MISYFQHLRALLHKNWIYYRRHYFVSFLELCLPVLLLLVIVVARKSTKTISFPPQTFRDPFVTLDKLNTISDSQYIHYPLAYDPARFLYTNWEQGNNSFLGRPAMGMLQFDIYQCFRRR